MTNNTGHQVAAEDRAVEILDAAGDEWAAEARRRRWTIQSEHDEHRRDRITVAGHVVYRVEDTGRWVMVRTAADNAHLVRPVRFSQLARVGAQHTGDDDRGGTDARHRRAS